MLLFVSWGKKFVIIECRHLMCHQVPMAFLLPLVYLRAVAYISVEISLGQR